MVTCCPPNVAMYPNVGFCRFRARRKSNGQCNCSRSWLVRKPSSSSGALLFLGLGDFCSAEKLTFWQDEAQSSEAVWTTGSGRLCCWSYPWEQESGTEGAGVDAMHCSQGEGTSCYGNLGLKKNISRHVFRENASQAHYWFRCLKKELSFYMDITGFGRLQCWQDFDINGDSSAGPWSRYPWCPECDQLWHAWGDWGVCSQVVESGGLLKMGSTRFSAGLGERAGLEMMVEPFLSSTGRMMAKYR